MTNNQMRMVLLILVLLQLPSPTLSQTKTKSQADVTSEALDERPPVSTYQILDQARQLADEARGLEPGEEVSYLERMSDHLWQWDPFFARRLLLRAFDLTVESLNEKRGANSGIHSADPRLTFSKIAALAARHDAKLEKQLTDSWQVSVASASDEVAGSQPDPAQLSYLLLGQSAGFLRKDEPKVRLLFG